ncbi:MAG: class I SAM-dependent methyltransferase [Desulfobacterales bacterium]|nr:class I SAM-dependent methyltransferase [Desulfobacterales bacterium]
MKRGVDQIGVYSLTEKTISDFGDQWSKYTDNQGWYGSIDLFKDMVNPILDLDTINGSCVIDIGSGTGRIVGMLLDAGVHHVYAVEPSHEAFRILTMNIKAMNRGEHVTPIHATGDRFELNEQVDCAFSIGVLHHIPDPIAVVQHVYDALKPGGFFFIWLYAYEGNTTYVKFLEPIRRITTKLPHRFLTWLAELFYYALSCYKIVCEFVTLPLCSYIKNVLWPMSPAKRRLVIYDQLNPSFSKYYTKEEAVNLLECVGFTNIRIHHRHGYSWSVIGYKPNSNC